MELGLPIPGTVTGGLEDLDLNAIFGSSGNANGNDANGNGDVQMGEPADASGAGEGGSKMNAGNKMM